MSEQSQKEVEEADKEIALLANAYDNYEKDGDLNRVINVYERCLTLDSESKWNSFNYCLKLVNLYKKAGENDEAWGFLNKMVMHFGQFSSPEYYLYKIRYEQFKILKSEKKHIAALQMLLLSIALQGGGFRKEKFIKEGKTAAKGIGLDEHDLENLCLAVERKIKGKDISVTQERMIIDIYNDFLRDKDLLEQ